MLTETTISKKCGRILDIAPLNRESKSTWLLLAEDGGLFRFDATSGESELVGRVEIPSETAEDNSFNGHTLRPHLHVSPRGEFAAVVNDYGRYGRIIDLRSGDVTMELDGGDYCCETVPFSFAFACREEQVIAIHRTDWNRLDVSNPSNGRVLTSRGPTSYRQGEERPQHYLDYFHGALYLSPEGTHILDDGWVWHPVGVPVVWSLDQWLSEGVWESEDGASKKEVCARDSYWDRGIAWLSEKIVAIAGIGDDEAEMTDGARIFDVSSAGKPSQRWRSDWLWAEEVTAFDGPAGRFFSDGRRFYSAAATGLFTWDTSTGQQTGHIEKFRPTHQHLGAGELAQLTESVLLRWNIEDSA